MTVPTIVGYNSGVNTTDTNTSIVTTPTNAAGDLIFIAISSDPPEQIFTAPANFATIYPKVDIRSGASNKATFAMFFKQSNGSEPSTYSIPVSIADRQAWVAFTVRGANGIHAKGTVANGDGVTAVIPSVVTTVADCLLAGIIATDGNTTPHTGATNYTKYTEITASGASSISLWFESAPVAGTQGSDTVTIPTEQWIGVALALSVNFMISVTDAVALTEQVALNIFTPVPTPTISVADTTTSTESVVTMVTTESQASDTVTLSESVAFVVSVIKVSASESVGIGEQANTSVPGLSNTQAIANDFIALTEQAAAIIGSSSFTLNNTVTLSEAVNLLLASLPAASDTSTLTEQTTIRIAMNVQVADDVTVAEILALLPTVGVQTVDSITVGEAVAYSDRFSVSVSESITLTDSVIIPEIILLPQFRDYRIGSDSANTLSTVIAAPAAQPKDFIFIGITSDAFNQVFTPPEGFVELYHTAFFATATFALYYKLSNGVEPSTYVVGMSILERQSWVAFSVSNAASPIHNTGEGILSGNHDRPMIPALTTTIDGCLVIGVLATNGYPAPFGNTGHYYSERYEAGGSSAGSMSIWSAYQLVAGVTDEETLTMSAVQPWLTTSFALSPLINRLVFPSETLGISDLLGLKVSDPQMVNGESVSLIEAINTTLVVNISVAENAITVSDDPPLAERFYNATVFDPVTLTDSADARMAENIKINIVNAITVSDVGLVGAPGATLNRKVTDAISVGELITMMVIASRPANPFGYCCGILVIPGHVLNPDY